MVLVGKVSAANLAHVSVTHYNIFRIIISAAVIDHVKVLKTVSKEYVCHVTRYSMQQMLKTVAVMDHVEMVNAVKLNNVNAIHYKT